MKLSRRESGERLENRFNVSAKFGARKTLLAEHFNSLESPHSTGWKSIKEKTQYSSFKMKRHHSN